MLDFEAVAAVRDFIETGGNVLLGIAFVTAVMWCLIVERFWYYRVSYQRERQQVGERWRGRGERSSWYAILSEKALDFHAVSAHYQRLISSPRVSLKKRNSRT